MASCGSDQHALVDVCVAEKLPKGRKHRRTKSLIHVYSRADRERRIECL